MILGTVMISTFTIVTFIFFRYNKHFLTIPDLPSKSDRLLYTLQLQSYALIPFYINIIHVIYKRLSSRAINPMSGFEKVVEMRAKTLTNTLEQYVFCFVNQMILSTLLPQEKLFAIPYLVFCFTFGRIIFMIGYPRYRGIGFSLGFLSHTLALHVNFLLVSGLSKHISFLQFS